MLHESGEVGRLDDSFDFGVFGLLGKDLLFEQLTALVIELLVFLLVLGDDLVVAADGLFHFVGDSCCLIQSVVYHFCNNVVLRK